jgi:hypothetical protein
MNAATTAGGATLDPRTYRTLLCLLQVLRDAGGPTAEAARRLLAILPPPYTPPPVKRKRQH